MSQNINVEMSAEEVRGTLSPKCQAMWDAAVLCLDDPSEESLRGFRLLLRPAEILLLLRAYATLVTSREQKFKEVLLKLLSTVENTGGVIEEPDGRVSGCAADEDWMDIAYVYLDACEALGTTPHKHPSELATGLETFEPAASKPA